MPVYFANDRRANYHPSQYAITRLSPTQYEATNKKTGKWLLFTVAWGRVFSVASDSGAEYEIVLGCCCCPDAHHGAAKAGRFCAHGAAAEQLEDYLEFERRSQAAAAQFQADSAEKCRRALAEVAPLAGPAARLLDVAVAA